jgi:hypothetical protein
LAQLAHFDFALCGVLAPKGPDKTAQGNALGTRKTAKNEGKSPEGALQPTGDVSPLQGSVEGFATATSGVARGCFVAAPLGRMKYSATSKLAQGIGKRAKESPRVKSGDGKVTITRLRSRRRGKARDFASLASPASRIAPNRCH